MKNPLVIGYKGEIGRYILNGLLSCMPKASNIWCYDVNVEDHEAKQRIDAADVIFLCLPIEETTKFFVEYKYFLRGKTVVEQTSVKAWVPELKKELATTYGCELVSMHILFRPSTTPNYEDHRIAVLGNKQSPGTTLVKNFVEQALKAKLIYIPTVAHHERMMAHQQALVHRVLLCLDACLPADYPDTYVSKRVRELSTRIRSGDSTLYSMIQSNIRLKDALRCFNERMKNFNIRKYFQGRIRP